MKTDNIAIQMITTRATRSDAFATRIDFSHIQNTYMPFNKRKLVLERYMGLCL